MTPMTQAAQMLEPFRHLLIVNGSTVGFNQLQEAIAAALHNKRRETLLEASDLCTALHDRVCADHGGYSHCAMELEKLATDVDLSWLSGLSPEASVAREPEPVDYAMMCGRCYDVVDAIFPADCLEKPENLAGSPLGQYHCPDCGAMVLAGIPHPPLCERCLKRQHPAYDEIPDDNTKR